MIQQELPRWVFASVSKHFNAIATVAFPMFVEGQPRDTKDLDQFFELRMDGPWFTELSKNYWRIYFEVNILVSTTINETNFHRIHSNVGVVAAKFTEIQVFKYGTGVNDDDSLFGCFKLLQDSRNREILKIFHFGQIDDTTKLTQASIEGHYELDKEIS